MAKTLAYSKRFLCHLPGFKQLSDMNITSWHNQAQHNVTQHNAIQCNDA